MFNFFDEVVKFVFVCGFLFLRFFCDIFLKVGRSVELLLRVFREFLEGRRVYLSFNFRCVIVF